MSFILPTGQELSFDIAFVRSHLRRIAVFLYTHKNGLKAVGALPPLIPYSNATTVRVLFRISFGLFTRRRTAYYFFSTIKNVKKTLDTVHYYLL